MRPHGLKSVAGVFTATSTTCPEEAVFDSDDAGGVLRVKSLPSYSSLSLLSEHLLSL